MKLKQLKIKSRFKNLNNIDIDFNGKEGITVLIGNNGSGKSNVLEAVSNIFACLYNGRLSPKFDYEINYKLGENDIYISYEDGASVFKVNDVVETNKAEYLPNQVISSYSGEENRLWKEYYEPFYLEYIRSLRNVTLPNTKLVYINKDYWDIALLTLHYYDFGVFTNIRDFCQTILGINTLSHIRFKFDLQNLRDWSRNPNPVTNFVKALNPNTEDTLTLTLEDLKNRVTPIVNERDFYRILSAAYMPDRDKLITGIELNINDNFRSDCLSEGEKKLILIKFILPT
jgi:energy-coupling factor transporter ATP-binding protein EcfA2